MDLLTEQSEESLKKMRDALSAELARLQAELARLTVEVKQVDEALARKTRRSRTGGGRLTREQVFNLVWMSDTPLTAADVRQLVAEQGIPATLNAVRNHLNRLVDEDKRLMRFPDNRYGLPTLEGEPAPPPPFPDEPEPSLDDAREPSLDEDDDAIPF